MARSPVDADKKVIAGGIGLSRDEWAEVDRRATSENKGRSAILRELVQRGMNPPAAGITIEDDILAAMVHISKAGNTSVQQCINNKLRFMLQKIGHLPTPEETP